MKKSLSLIFFLLVLAFPMFADLAGYKITNYKINGVLYDNNVLSVVETIDVNFSEPRHGIYRNIPTSFYLLRQKNENGSKYNMHYLTYIDTINTYNDESSISTDDTYCKIRIGNASTTVTGDHTYTISYDITFPDDRTALSDFLYVSVLGTEWETTIDHFSYEITFDKGIPSGTDFKIYSGEFGTTGNPLNATLEKSNNKIWGSVDSVGEKQGVTVFAELPEGYFVDTIKTSPVLCWIFSVLTILIALYSIIMILKTGHRKPVQTVEFYPPNNITPAEVGYIIDNSADDIDFTALIPYLAQKGFISITEEETKRFSKTPTLKITKVKNLPKDYPDYVKTAFNAMFEKESFTTDDVPESFIKKLNEAKTQLQEHFTEDKKLYTNTSLSLTLLFFCCTFCALAVSTSSGVSLWDNWIYALIVGFLFLIGLSTNKFQYTKRFSPRKKLISKIIFYPIILLMVAVSVDDMINDLNVPSYLLFAVFLTTIPVCLFNGRMIQMTEFNCETAGKLLGLKEFIRVAEVPKLNVLMSENPNYYYDVLPFAMVFGLADKWAKNFESITLQSPSWYYGTYSAFDAMYFDRTVSKGITSSINSARAAASSSSGGGGGFSGGGGGGGGGGSW